MLGFNGGLIGKTQTTSVSASLPGMWTLSEHLEAKRNNSWPIVTGGVPDPDFDKVQLLLLMNGSNGSTTFTDDSSFSRTITRVGATISTVQSKYGGSSGSFIPTSYLQMAAATGLQFTGDFTIEVWAFPTVAADMIIGTSSTDFNVQIFRLNENGAGTLSFYINGTQVFSPTSAGITANTWQHLAFSRTGTNSRMFVNGIQIGSTVTNWSGTFRLDLIGTFFYQGTRLGNDYRGYLDDFRITKGLGRYSANFTPPSAL